MNVSRYTFLRTFMHKNASLLKAVLIITMQNNIFNINVLNRIFDILF